MSCMTKFFYPLCNKRGQGLVEYSLLLVLVAVVVIAAVRSFGTSTSTLTSKVGSAVTNAK